VKGNLSSENFIVYNLDTRLPVSVGESTISMERMGIHQSDERMMAAIA
jgi:hypothetical protein